MDGLEQVQKTSWYRDSLELSDEGTLEVMTNKPLCVVLEDLKGQKSQEIRRLYFYASTGQYMTLLAQSIPPR